MKGNIHAAPDKPRAAGQLGWLVQVERYQGVSYTFYVLDQMDVNGAASVHKTSLNAICAPVLSAAILNGVTYSEEQHNG